jgi:HEPN domain-containing protein
MAEDRPEALEAERWLAYAREDFAHGQLGAASFPRSAAWGFQQAAEKAFKAVLIAQCLAVPRTHDIAFLLTCLHESDPVVDSLREDVLALTAISPAMRYPGDWPDLGVEDVRALSAASARILAWAEENIAQRRNPDDGDAL